MNNANATPNTATTPPIVQNTMGHIQSGSSEETSKIGMSEQDEINRDLDLFEAEREYERTKPKLSDVEWLHVFPEAKKRYGKGIKVGLIVEKITAQLTIEFIKWKTRWELRKLYIICEIPKDQWLVDRAIERLTEEKRQAEKRLSAAIHRMQFFNTIGRKDTSGKVVVINDMMIQRAKQHPIENLVEINRAGFTRCFAHNDTKPSAYAKKNFIHCFVCSKSWDTIQVLVDRDGYKFREAVMRLQ